MKEVLVRVKNYLGKLLWWRNQGYVATECGHKTKLKEELEVFGEKIEVTLKLEKGKIEYCQNCLSEMAIQCAWCEELILPGDPITLYTPKKDFEVPDHAVVYNEKPLQLVGCLRMDCAESGADRSGFWTVPGKVFRVLSPLEQAMASSKMVVVGDLININEAIEEP